jgi:hypothetical protein
MEIYYYAYSINLNILIIISECIKMPELGSSTRKL